MMKLMATFGGLVTFDKVNRLIMIMSSGPISGAIGIALFWAIAASLIISFKSFHFIEKY